MWSVAVVVVSPVLDKQFRFGESVEQLDAEQLVADSEQNDSTYGFYRASLARCRRCRCG
jgi:hypothetical protein